MVCTTHQSFLFLKTIIVFQSQICIVFIPTQAIIIHNLIETKEILNWNTVRCTITQIEDVKDYFTIKGEESYTITKEFDLEYIVNNETIASQTSFGTTLGFYVRNTLSKPKFY